jgi:bacteriocin-like protein
MNFFKKKTEKPAISKATISKLDKNQLQSVIGGVANPGTPIGGIIVKGGKNPGGQM